MQVPQISPTPLPVRLADGASFGCLWLALGSTAVAELAADAAPDAIVFDLQHGLWERQGLEAAIGIVRGRSAPLVRVAENSPHAIGSALDAGAVGVIVPLVESAEEAARAVAAAHYPPAGMRSGGGVRPLMDWKRYAGRANDEIMVAVMIETKAGVANAAAIAATPGVDMVFIGTGDLALSLGTFPDPSPVHEAAIQDVARACAIAGTPCGIFTLHAAIASDRRRQGFAMVVLGDDMTMLHGAAKANVRRFRGELPAGDGGIPGSVALVTGTSRGIGPQIVRALLAKGAKTVWCGARNEAAIADLIAEAPDRLKPLKLDVTDPAAIAAAAEQARDTTLLVNNAGINFNTPLLGVPDLANARAEMEVNYFGTLAMCRAFAPVLKANGGGTIVTLLSILAHMNLPLMGSLCASKAAALSAVQGLRAELKAQDTRVMAVLPGAVDTDMTRGLDIPKLAPGAVATALVDGLERGLDEVYPGDMASGVAFGLALDPKAVEQQFAGFLPQ